MGSWILFSPPEAAVYEGIVAAFGYAIGASLPPLLIAFIGPRMRQIYPNGVTFSDYIGDRYGSVMQVYTCIISIIYMFVFMVSELTSIGAVVSLLTHLDYKPVICWTAITTFIYTTYGGLKSSVWTDRIQGVVMMLLLVVTAIAIGVNVDTHKSLVRESNLLKSSNSAWKYLTTLIISSTAAELLNQSYYQRVYATLSQGDLIKACALASFLEFLTILLFGFYGMISVFAGTVDYSYSSTAFFTLFVGMDNGINVIILIFATILAASSVDTLQSSIIAAVQVDLLQDKVNVNVSRFLMIGMNIGAIFWAFDQTSIFRLFLIADLWAAMTVVPLMLGLSPRLRVTSLGALLGCVSGIVSVIVLGWAKDGSIVDGFKLLGVPDLGISYDSFLTPVLVSPAVCLAVSWLLPAWRLDFGAFFKAKQDIIPLPQESPSLNLYGPVDANPTIAATLS
eukprot:TRINITY_DN2750_c0_g1_i2.p1 TRINITY_DN2750_c0_g1~~TRINITY_DN2750_c0_g1_i2.p1  ORF type:complete len:451 (-),score=123.88 TRINITY_DN2750_c0_g1_i2:38-1390(-)